MTANTFIVCLLYQLSGQKVTSLGFLCLKPLSNCQSALQYSQLILSVQYFYEEQLHRMECLAQEPVLFEDVLCQMHDMIQPAQEGFFTLQDLKRAKSLSGTLFNILFNLNKFVAFETRDPFLIRQVMVTQPFHLVGTVTPACRYSVPDLMGYEAMVLLSCQLQAKEGVPCCCGICMCSAF